MIDNDGYPTEDTLDRIRQFNVLKDDPFEFVEYLCDNWCNGSYTWKPETGCLELHTLGWSGCESIIAALNDTPVFPSFWQMYWYKSIRGGHYWFVVKRLGK